MKILIESTIEDSEIDEQIKEYGQNKIADKLKVSKAHISMVLAGKHRMSLDKYILLKQILKP
jgi:transcriptional regulator with XRE-family HTH domain